MEPVQMDTMSESQQQSADPLHFERSYQVEALEKALNENTIVFLETGSGKALIAIMLLRSYAYLLRKPSPFIAVFLVPTVVLVTQVLAMTPAILLSALACSYLKLDFIKVLIFDECHNARGRHPYACIMSEFHHPQLCTNRPKLPRIFVMTASPVKAKASSAAIVCKKQISELENLMHSKMGNVRFPIPVNRPNGTAVSGSMPSSSTGQTVVVENPVCL